MAKGDTSDQILNTPADQVQAPPEVVNAPVDGIPSEEPQEDVKVTKGDYRVKSSIGLNFGKLETVDGREVYRQNHRLVEPGEVLKHEDFGATEEERKTTKERLLGLDAIEPAKDK